MHDVLVKIRAKIDNLSNATGDQTLEARFKGNLICNIADGNVNPYARELRSTPVAILELATTRAARLRTPYAKAIRPALNGRHLDSFIDTKSPPDVFSLLEEADVSQESGYAHAD